MSSSISPPHLTHPSLRSRHGFFGSRGGVSQGMYASLNCGFGSDDAPANVAENRNRVRASLRADALQTCHQVHSSRAVLVDAQGECPEADGLVTTTPGLALGTLSADCAPVLLESADGAVVGACHAGWRGAVAGITDATVELMRERGARGIRAVVGPSISLESYEVGGDFQRAVLEQDAGAGAFFHLAPAGARPWVGEGVHFDLPNYVVARLRRLGVEAEWVGACTYTEGDRWFSYRRNTHRGLRDYGRDLSAIVI